MHKADLVYIAIGEKRDSLERHQYVRFDFWSPADVFWMNIVISCLCNHWRLFSTKCWLRKLWLPLMLATLLILPCHTTWTLVNVMYRRNGTLFSMRVIENCGSKTQTRFRRPSIIDETSNFFFIVLAISLRWTFLPSMWFLHVFWRLLKASIDKHRVL